MDDESPAAQLRMPSSRAQNSQQPAARQDETSPVLSLRSRRGTLSPQRKTCSTITSSYYKVCLTTQKARLRKSSLERPCSTLAPKHHAPLHANSFPTP